MGWVAMVLAAAGSACSVPPAEHATQLSLDYAAFDSRGGQYGWRILNATGCTDSAVSLLSDYSEARASQLSGEQRLEISFHIGQTLAMAGREEEAIAHFERAQSAAATPEWRAYVAATLAFLHHDAPALASARQAYSAIAPGSMRLRIIDGLRRMSGRDVFKGGALPDIGRRHESYSGFRSIA